MIKAWSFHFFFPIYLDVTVTYSYEISWDHCFSCIPKAQFVVFSLLLYFTYSKMSIFF